MLKVYDQAGRVLRVEVKGLNTAGLGCGKGLGKLGEQLGCVQGMLERFLASLQARRTWRFWTRGSLSAGPNRASAATGDGRAWI